MKSLLLLFSFLLFGNAQAGELYRSIDSGGKVHYSDAPLHDAQDVEQLKTGGEPAPDEGLPYETRVAQQNFPVTLYVFDGCGAPCANARQLLQKRGVPFTEKNLATEEDLDAFRKSSGTDQAPTMSVGKTWVSGFRSEQWNKELDFAGYPKSAPYRAQPVAASSARSTKPAQ